jgi:hypothetical protein
MLVNLALAFSLVGVSVVIHGLGTLALLVRLSTALRKKGGRGRLASGVLTARLISGLLVLHLLEASAWAVLYWLSGGLPDAETAFYFSLTSYTTVGYGDVILPTQQRLLGPFEAATGILMFGWSTGVMVSAITRIHADQLRSLAGATAPGAGEVGHPPAAARGGE